MNTTVETFYVDGFQYKGDNLQFFPHAEGYVNCNAPKLLLVPTSDRGLQEVYLDDGTPTFSYVYNYTDHLGNIRLSYTKNPQSGALSIIEENHYYPFGLKHNNYNSDKNMYAKEQEQLKIKPVPPLFKSAYNYKYNGKELQDELGLNMYDYGARNYDPARAGWSTIDPLAEKMRRWSPYNYCFDNPMRFVDPDVMGPQWHRDLSGVLTADAGDKAESLAKFRGISVDEAKSELNHSHFRFESTMSGGEKLYQSERFVSSGEYGPLSMCPDAMSLSYNVGINTGFLSLNVSSTIAASGNDGAFVFSGNISKGVNSPKEIGFKDGFQLAVHNNYGGNKDVLSGLGGKSTGYAATLFGGECL
ncbi:RHS repeat-associated core domain-containing protein [Flavobacterium sp. SUN046]|uniref:RHS repeat domain-containing protein n=1 Tax=Flavobacterium sp. SUN046 TaxID=3002440 RepID=UPI002DB99D66|nr:RHS repeat-associated core domain-containing protein [Flavobacterium sp. SUN046]MEC4048606.1 RHS repeat-associated core domain-containing protein [Flavobacterium sp. SUN046]